MNWDPPQLHPFEKKENPQAYDRLVEYNEHPKPTQHILGIVGGNEVPYGGRLNQVDIESDLRGTTRHNSFCPTRKHAAPSGSQTIVRKQLTGQWSVTPHTTPLAQSQMWAYPATIAPEPVSLQMCVRPEKL
jgi:hypothetical protein